MIVSRVVAHLPDVGQAAYDEGASAAALSVVRLSANAVRAVIGGGAGSLTKDPLKDEYTYRANLAIGADSQGLLNPTLNTTLGGFSSSVTTPVERVARSISDGFRAVLFGCLARIWAIGTLDLHGHIMSGL